MAEESIVYMLTACWVTENQKEYCKEHFDISAGTEIPILQKQEEYISFETIPFTTWNIRMQQFDDQTSNTCAAN